jgi:uncharacterized membrane protein (UPF0182 family)
MRPTLAEALTAAFGESLLPGNTSGSTDTSGTAGGTTGGTGTGGTLNQQARDLIALASQQFDDAQAALQAGDFAGYGLKIEALQKTLRDLQSLK